MVDDINARVQCICSVCLDMNNIYSIMLKMFLLE